MTTFGERLRSLRESKKMTQIELAEKLSVVNSTVSQWEANRRVPDPEMLKKIADLFGVSVDYLLCRVNEAPQSNERALPDWVSKLPPDMQEFVREESKHGWPYLRLARGLKMKDLSPAELEAIVETWMDAKRRYEREFEKEKKNGKT